MYSAETSSFIIIYYKKAKVSYLKSIFKIKEYKMSSINNCYLQNNGVRRASVIEESNCRTDGLPRSAQNVYTKTGGQVRIFQDNIVGLGLTVVFDHQATDVQIQVFEVEFFTFE